LPRGQGRFILSRLIGQAFSCISQQRPSGSPDNFSDEKIAQVLYPARQKRAHAGAFHSALALSFGELEQLE